MVEPHTMESPSAVTDDPLAQLAVAPIFVVGAPRSGTTWVYDILTAHPQAAGVLESFLFTRTLGIGRLFDPRIWDPERITKLTGEPIGLAQLATREEVAAEVRRFVGRLLSRTLEPHHRFLIEKTPVPWSHPKLVTEVFPEARFVHIVRDGRDVTVSLRAAARSWNPGWGEFAPGASIPVRRHLAVYRSGRAWTGTIQNTRGDTPDDGDRYLEVRYEEIRARPVAAFRELFDFCHMPYDDELLEQVLEATDFDRHFEGGEDKPRRGGRVGDWRERFGLLDAIAFELGSRGALAELSYERSRLWWAGGGVRARGAWPDRRQ